MADNTAGMELPIGVTENKMLQQLARLEKKLLDTQDKAGKGFVKANAAATGSFLKMSKSAQAGIQNVSYQMQDLIVQISSGQGASRALSQQLPQLLSGFGVFGAILGTVAGATIPLAASFFNTGEEGKALKKKVDDLTKSIDEYRGAVKDASLPTDELAKKYGTATAAAREFLDALVKIDRAKTITGAQDIGKEIAKGFGDFGGLNGSQVSDLAAKGVAGIKRELQDVARQFTVVTDAAKRLDLSNLQASLQGQANDAEAIAKAIEKIQDKLGLSKEAATQFASALADLAQAKTVGDLVSAFSEIKQQIEAAYPDINNMPTAVADLYHQAANAGEAMANLTGASESAGTAISNAANEAARLAQNLGAAMAALAQVEQGIVTANRRASNQLKVKLATVGNPEGRAAGLAREKYNEASGAAAYAAIANGSTSTLTELSRRTAAQAEAAKEIAAAQEQLSAAEKAFQKSQSSSGKDKTAKDRQKFFDTADQQMESMKRQIELLGKTKAEAAALEAKWKLLDEAKKRGIDLDSQVAGSGETVREQIDRQAQSIGDLTAKYEQARERAQFFEQAQQTLKDGLVDAIVEGKNLSGVLEDLAKMLAKAALQAALFGDGPLGGSGSGLLGGIVSGIFGGGSTPTMPKGGYTLANVNSFDGGGFTGLGIRSGGIDGKGGFPAILHPNETILDHTKGQSGGVSVSMSIDARGAKGGEAENLQRVAGQIVDQAVAKVKAAQKRGY
ncbi:hypothetical protein [Thioclava sp. DLFJ4-1]|uniref:hypothetical protein n=1 Tax=Thioclava sp. DLFJ4-1 TaxID=1915313 RepID=UPI0009961D33|nr:hypothetical protein [Thioclava sp. DLFJ4-1]OOY16716.1 hypothetical protein BMI85_06525 [Thioclava sp. DLFJ4-1]